jgi:hypothetical protein
VFGTVGEYDAAGYPVEPTEADYGLVGRGAGAWAGFAATGRPGGHGGGGGEGFRGFETALGGEDGEVGEVVRVFVVGGPEEGLSSVDGRGAREAVQRQRLRERCAFINSDEMIEQMGY